MFDRLYEYAVRWRNKRFDTQKIEIYTSAIPIISVGNITTGGTGKSPFVQCLARHYINTQKRVAIIGRGYKRKSSGFLLVSDGKTIIENAQTAGDELMMHAVALQDAIIIADESRTRAVKWIEHNNAADIIILDDCFQHRYIHRDADIVLIDSKTFSERLLPYGHLREPLTSLKRAHILCFAESCTEQQINTFVKGNDCNIIPYFNYSIKFSRWRKAWSNTTITIESKNATVISSIAHPERFYSTIQKEGITILRKFRYKDHYMYKNKDIHSIMEGISSEQPLLIMTTKDEGKLLPYKNVFSNNMIQCIVADIEIDIQQSADFFAALNTLLKEKLYAHSTK